jgi:hypothetical protein
MNPETSGAAEPDAPPAKPRPMSPYMFLGIVIAACLVFNLCVPLVRIPPHSLSIGSLIAVAVLPTAMFMFLQLALALAIVRLRLEPTPALILMGSALTLWALMLMYGRDVAHRGLTTAMAGVFQDLGMSMACIAFGILVSRIVRAPNVLLPVALISMPIDFIGVLTPIGFTQNVVKNHPQVLKNVAVHVPTVHGLPLHVMIGPADICFMALFFAIVLRFGMNMRATFAAMYVLLTGALLAVTFGRIAIPALVPMGVAVIGANIRHFRFSRSEVFAMVYAGGLVLALVVGFYYYSHMMFFQPHPGPR